MAVTHVNTGSNPAAADYKEATFESTVTKIVPGTEADLSVFKDASKLAGQTPYYVFTEHKLTSLSAPSAGISEPSVTALLKDGTEAQKLILFGSFDKCDSTSLKTEGDGDAFTFIVGSAMTSCEVFLAPAGDSISSVAYTDSGFSYKNYNDNKFLDNPIIWKQ